MCLPTAVGRHARAYCWRPLARRAQPKGGHNGAAKNALPSAQPSVVLAGGRAVYHPPVGGYVLALPAGAGRGARAGREGGWVGRWPPWGGPRGVAPWGGPKGWPRGVVSPSRGVGQYLHPGGWHLYPLTNNVRNQQQRGTGWKIQGKRAMRNRQQRRMGWKKHRANGWSTTC